MENFKYTCLRFPYYTIHLRNITVKGLNQIWWTACFFIVFLVLPCYSLMWLSSFLKFEVFVSGGCCRNATRVLKKKKLKINMHRPVGTRVVFDDEGNTLPPLATLADSNAGSDSVKLDKDKGRSNASMCFSFCYLTICYFERKSIKLHSNLVSQFHNSALYVRMLLLGFLCI